MVAVLDRGRCTCRNSACRNSALSPSWRTATSKQLLDHKLRRESGTTFSGVSAKTANETATGFGQDGWPTKCLPRLSLFSFWGTCSPGPDHGPSGPWGSSDCGPLVHIFEILSLLANVTSWTHVHVRYMSSSVRLSDCLSSVFNVRASYILRRLKFSAVFLRHLVRRPSIDMIQVKFF